MEDYRGQHQAPMKGDGAPLWDLTLNDIYPKDAYGELHYYSNSSRVSMGVISSYHDRPNRVVSVYRAIPHTATSQEQINKLEKQLKLYMSRRIVPAPYAGSTGFDQEKEWYEAATKKLKQLQQMPVGKTKRIQINPGDWVTLARSYAKEHGVSSLNGEYKIITKKVFARDLYTDGNSLDEWGYDPTSRIDTRRQKNENIELATILRLAGIK